MTSTELRIILGVLQMKKITTMMVNILAIPWSLFSLLLALAFLRGEFLIMKPFYNLHICNVKTIDLMILKVRLLRMMSRRKGTRAITTKLAMRR